MNLVLRILRDPIWQVLGVFVGVIALFVATTQTTSNRSELSVVHIRQTRMADYWMSGARIKLLIQGTKREIEKTVVDYYMLVDSSTDPIHPTDFIAPLEISAGAGAKRILAVESCSKPVAQACSSDGSSTVGGGNYVQTNWGQKADRWIAAPLLLNNGDQACVMVVSELIDNPGVGASTSSNWSARITKVQLKAYDSLQAFANRDGKRLIDYVWTSVTLQGSGVYWFVLLLAVSFVATASLAVRGGWLVLTSRTGMFQCVLAILLCASTSEIFVDIFVNRKGDWRDPTLHPIVWPLLTLHTALVVFLARRALRAEHKGSSVAS